MTETNPVPETDVESNPNCQLSPETEYVERTDVGVSLTVKLSRGTGTRDQDKITAKVKARTLDEAREDMETLRAYVHELADDVRQIQPDEPE